MIPADHRYLGAFLRNGYFRGACSCGVPFVASTRDLTRQQFDAHREPETKEAA